MERAYTEYFYSCKYQNMPSNLCFEMQNLTVRDASKSMAQKYRQYHSCNVIQYNNTLNNIINVKQIPIK